MTKIIKKLGVMLFALISCILAGFFTMDSSNVGYAESALTINHFNLSFRDNVCIKYAVETDLEDTKVLVWTEVSDSYEKGTENDVLETVGIQVIDGKEHQIFDYTKLYAKNMTDDVYARAYAIVDGAEYYSPVAKYSILQYAYNKLGKTDTASENEKLKVALTKMLEYGAAMQEYTGYNLDRLATDNFVQVKLSNGVLSDGFTDGLYKEGSTVTLIAPETNNEGDVFIRWVDKADNIVSETATYTLTVGAENNTYTPVYEAVAQGLTFASNGDGTCSVTGIGTCTDTDIVIPSVSPEGDRVTSIGGSAFQKCTNLTSIEIPDSVTSIDASAFEGCSGLTSIAVDKDNTAYQSIEGSLYSKDGKTLLQYIATQTATTFIMSDRITSIAEYAFYNCSNLTTVYYEGEKAQWSAISIGNNNTPLTNATKYYYSESIPPLNEEGTAYDDNYWHYVGGEITEWVYEGVVGTEGLVYTLSDDGLSYSVTGYTGTDTAVVIPQYYNRLPVISIGSYAFSGCSTFTSVEIPDSVTSIGNDAFYNCKNLRKVDIGDGVTSIGSSAFSGCSRLMSIDIPDSVTSIGSSAFSGCSNLTEMTLPFVGNSRKTASDTYQYPFGYIFGESSYDGGVATTQSYCGSSTSYTTSTTYYIPSSLKKVTITGGNILYGAFYNCSSLTSVVIGNGVTSIGGYAFSNCSSLTSIVIPDSVTSIGNSAFV